MLTKHQKIWALETLYVKLGIPAHTMHFNGLVWMNFIFFLKPWTRGVIFFKDGEGDICFFLQIPGYKCTWLLRHCAADFKFVSFTRLSNKPKRGHFPVYEHAPVALWAWSDVRLTLGYVSNKSLNKTCAKWFENISCIRATTIHLLL